MRTSNPPSPVSAVSNQASSSVWFETSTRAAAIWPLLRRKSLRAASSTSQTWTRAPAAAKLWAMLRPMPEAAAVMRTRSGWGISIVTFAARLLAPERLLPAALFLRFRRALSALLFASQHQPGANLMLLEEVHHVDQHIVALCFEDGNRAPGGLSFAALDQAALERGIPFGIFQIRPWEFQRGVELLDEVAHAARPAGEMIGEERPHEGPAQTRRIDDGIIDIARGADVLVEYVERLAPHRLLQAVADIAFDLAL